MKTIKESNNIIVNGCPVDKLPDSMFFDGEKEIAINSINNK